MTKFQEPNGCITTHGYFTQTDHPFLLQIDHPKQTTI